MGKSFFKALHLSSILLSVLFMASCTQVVPEVKYSSLSVVFDYKDEKTLPSARLCVFVETVSDARRYESINVKCVQNGFTWDVNDVFKIKSYDRMYAGNTSLLVPEGEKIQNCNNFVQAVGIAMS